LSTFYYNYFLYKNPTILNNIKGEAPAMAPTSRLVALAWWASVSLFYIVQLYVPWLWVKRICKSYLYLAPLAYLS
jgi:hypothetical protein